MKTLKIELDDKVLSQAEWPAFIPTSDLKFPRAYRIQDMPNSNYTAYKFFFSQNSNMYTTVPIPLNFIDEENQAAPNVGISEGFILRALAIAQNPSLAKELV